MTPPARRQSEGQVRLRGTSVFRGNRYHDATWVATVFWEEANRACGGAGRAPSACPTLWPLASLGSLVSTPFPTRARDLRSGACPMAGRHLLAGHRSRFAYVAVSPPMRAVEPT